MCTCDVSQLLDFPSTREDQDRASSPNTFDDVARPAAGADFESNVVLADSDSELDDVLAGSDAELDDDICVLSGVAPETELVQQVAAFQEPGDEDELLDFPGQPAQADRSRAPHPTNDLPPPATEGIARSYMHTDDGSDVEIDDATNFQEPGSESALLDFPAVAAAERSDAPYPTNDLPAPATEGVPQSFMHTDDGSDVEIDEITDQGLSFQEPGDEDELLDFPPVCDGNRCDAPYPTNDLPQPAFPSDGTARSSMHTDEGSDVEVDEVTGHVASFQEPGDEDEVFNTLGAGAYFRCKMCCAEATARACRLRYVCGVMAVLAIAWCLLLLPCGHCTVCSCWTFLARARWTTAPDPTLLTTCRTMQACNCRLCTRLLALSLLKLPKTLRCTLPVFRNQGTKMRCAPLFLCWMPSLSPLSLSLSLSLSLCARVGVGLPPCMYRTVQKARRRCAYSYPAGTYTPLLCAFARIIESTRLHSGKWLLPWSAIVPGAYPLLHNMFWFLPTNHSLLMESAGVHCVCLQLLDFPTTRETDLCAHPTPSREQAEQAVEQPLSAVRIGIEHSATDTITPMCTPAARSQTSKFTPAMQSNSVGKMFLGHSLIGNKVPIMFLPSWCLLLSLCQVLQLPEECRASKSQASAGFNLACHQALYVLAITCKVLSIASLFAYSRGSVTLVNIFMAWGGWGFQHVRIGCFDGSVRLSPFPEYKHERTKKEKGVKVGCGGDRCWLRRTMNRQYH